MSYLQFLLITGIVIIVLTIFRFAILWYLKINKTIDLLTKIEKNTRKEIIQDKNKDKKIVRL